MRNDKTSAIQSLSLLELFKQYVEPMLHMNKGKCPDGLWDRYEKVLSLDSDPEVSRTIGDLGCAKDPSTSRNDRAGRCSWRFKCTKWVHSFLQQ